MFVANDQMALGVLRALHEAGRRIPADVSVVGFDDVPEAPYFTPPLTTIRQDFGEMGRRGLKLLLETMEDPDGPPRHLEVDARADRALEHDALARRHLTRAGRRAARHRAARRAAAVRGPPPRLDAAYVSANIALASLGRSKGDA